MGKKSNQETMGRGRVIAGIEDMGKILAMINCLPDCIIDNDGRIHYSHCKTTNADIYYLTNQSEGQKVEFTAKFRVTGKVPEIWYPTSGEIRDLKGYNQADDYTEIPLVLQPNECAFVVFRASSEKNSIADLELNFPKRKGFADLNTGWVVDFKDKMRGPKQPVVFNQLTDWSKNENDLIKYYSGTAVYSTDFTLKKLPKNQNIILNLSYVADMAKVKINGEYVGGVWTFPYELDVSDFVRKGENSIEIEVVNTWVNRLIGDLKLPENKRSTWTVHRPGADQPLKASGLLGEVYLETYSK